MTTIYIQDLTGRVIGATSGSYFNAWELITEICADEFRCQPDDVTDVENEDGEEIIHIAGEPKARLLYRRPR